MPAGWTTPEDGVWGDMDTARDTAAALQGRREEAKAWKGAFQDLKTELATSAQEQEQRLKSLEGQFQNERSAWKAEVKKSRAENIFWMVVIGGLGFVAGSSK